MNALSLTKREREVLALAAQCDTAKQIRQALGVTERLAKIYMAAAISKLKARNRTHAVTIGLRNKLID